MCVLISSKKYVLRQRLNVSTDNVGSLRYSGRLFHTIGPDAVKERRPYADRLTGGTTSLLLSEDLKTVTR